LRWIYFAAGWICFGLGVAGALLPLMPGTPFMLLALWAFARSSKRFHHWLYNHRLFGAPLRRWHTDRVVPLSVKIVAYLSMLATFTYLALIADYHWAVPLASGCLILVGIFVLSRFPSK